MSRPDRRDYADYEPLRSADAVDLAGEFLKRNPQYERDRDRLARRAADTPLSRAELDEFETTWGMRFRRWRPPLVWTPAALPTVVGVCSAPPALTGIHRRSDTRQHAGASEVRVELLDSGDADAVLLPLNPLFPIRVAAALRLWRALSGRALGGNPQTLPPLRRARLVLALRALDARQARVSYRQIADGLFGPLPLRGDADWNSHDLRDRTIRLARLGQELMRGGYRRLLLYPYRRLR